MYDFSNSSIYILKNNIDDKFYIGSTIYSIQSRLEYHTGAKVSSWNTHRSSPLYLHFNSIGWHNVTATLLEKVNCVSRDHLYISETKHLLPHINTINCLNIRIPFSYYKYCFSKCAILNHSSDHIYNQFLHYKKFKPALRELLKLTKIYPTDYIYGRAKYLFQFVLEEFMMFIDFIPHTCSAESTATSVISTPYQPKKRGRPKKIPLPEPSEPIPPKKRGRPKKNKDVPPEPLETPPQPSPETQPDPPPEIPQPEAPTSPKPAKICTKVSKKKTKYNTDSLVPLTSFIPVNSI